MKRETFRHPKLLDLASRLGCSRPEAIGYLQLLWDFTAEYAIQGDIGKHADGAIARACDYPGNPEAFIQAFVESRWLDKDPSHRLLVHHWSEHCERWVKLKAEKIKKPFIEPTVESPVERPTETPEESSAGASPPCDQSNPIQSNPTSNGQQVDRFPDWWGEYPKKRKKKTAREIWKRKRLDAMANSLIADVLLRLEKDQQWIDGFIPDPTTYLNQERWEDEFAKAKPKSLELEKMDSTEILALAQELGVSTKGKYNSQLFPELRRAWEKRGQA